MILSIAFPKIFISSSKHFWIAPLGTELWRFGDIDDPGPPNIGDGVHEYPN